jgi:L-asparaginase/Glu-tRNA(Gln) amidotransferase subunit D
MLHGAIIITATGGTITCCGDYKIHTFTSDGTFAVSTAPIQQVQTM